MLRKIHTSCNRRKFLHEQTVNSEVKSNNITRPPTSHPYSAIRNIRSQDNLQQKYGYANKSYYEKDSENKDLKSSNEIVFYSKFKEYDLPKAFTHVLT